MGNSSSRPSKISVVSQIALNNVADCTEAAPLLEKERMYEVFNEMVKLQPITLLSVKQIKCALPQAGLDEGLTDRISSFLRQRSDDESMNQYDFFKTALRAHETLQKYADVFRQYPLFAEF